MTFEHVVEAIGFAVDGAGVVIIVIGVVIASVGVLALIVLIRSFLSVTLTMEVQGRLPWKSDTRERQ